MADLASQELHSLCTVAENDGLRDVQLGEQGVQAVELLTLLEECIELGQTLQRELVGDFEVLGVGDVALLEVADLDRVRCTEKTDLPVSWHHLKNVLDDLLELTRDESIDLIENDKFALVKFGLSTSRQVQDSTGSGHDHMDCLPHTNNIFVDSRTTSRHHALHAFVFADFFDDQRSLHGELSHWHEHHRLNLVQTCVDFLDQGDAISCSLSSSIFSLSDYVHVIDYLGNSLLLDWGWQLEAHLKDALQMLDRLVRSE